MKTRTRFFVASLLSFLASPALVACGDDSSGSDNTGTAATSGGGGASGGGMGMPTGGTSTTGVPNPGTTGVVTPPGGTPTAGTTGTTLPTNPGATGGDTGGMTGTGGTTGNPSGTTGGTTGTTGGTTGTTGGTTGTMGGSGGTTTPAGGSSSEGGAGTVPTAGAAGEGTGPGPVIDGVNVQMDVTHQPIQGFGINSALMPGGSNFPVNEMFSTDGPNGIGLSILRVGMNTDGSLTGQGVSEARAAGAKIIGSCWSAPANCKSNNNTKDGGYLLESCYDSWSTTIANFAEQQNLYAMSIANESDFASCPGNPVCTDSYETMTYTAKQMVEWVKVAGPKIAAKGVKVIAPEASEWIHVWGNISGTGSIVASHPDSSDPHNCGCFGDEPGNDGCSQSCIDGNGYDYGHWLWNDQDAWNAFDILGVHEYDSQVAFPWPDDVNDGVRDKEIWQTEMSGVMHWPEQGPSTDINNGVAVAGWIHSALTVGEASAWLWWWYESYYQNDNEGLAIIQGSNTIAKRYYTLGNYSKFVRPGFVAVEVAGNDNADVLLSAYKGEDDTVVVVAINKGNSAAEIPITITGGTLPTSMTPHVTSATENLAAGTAVPVADGVFTASLPSMTVTSFVGD